MIDGDLAVRIGLYIAHDGADDRRGDRIGGRQTECCCGGPAHRAGDHAGLNSNTGCQAVQQCEIRLVGGDLEVTSDDDLSVLVRVVQRRKQGQLRHAACSQDAAVEIVVVDAWVQHVDDADIVDAPVDHDQVDQVGITLGRAHRQGLKRDGGEGVGRFAQLVGDASLGRFGLLRRGDRRAVRQERAG